MTKKRKIFNISMNIFLVIMSIAIIICNSIGIVKMLLGVYRNEVPYIIGIAYTVACICLIYKFTTLVKSILKDFKALKQETKTYDVVDYEITE